MLRPGVFSRVISAHRMMLDSPPLAVTAADVPDTAVFSKWPQPRVKFKHHFLVTEEPLALCTLRSVWMH